MMGKVRKFFENYWATILITVIFVVIYDYLTQNEKIDTLIFPDLELIVDVFREYWKDMLKNMLESFQLLFPSLFLGTAIALVCGVILGTFTRVRVASDPIIQAVSTVPALLLGPIALYIAPSFSAASRFLIVWDTIWPTLFATITGVRTVEKYYLENADALELKGIQRMFMITLPAAMPSIMSGFIIALRGSFMVLVFAEMYGSDYGMGFFIKRASQYGVYPRVWAGIIFMAAVLLVVLKIFNRIQDKLLCWKLE